jgi:hypothetical protein
MKNENYFNTLAECVVTQEEAKVIDKVFAKCYHQSRLMGWHDKLREDGTMIALIHSEISEAMEGLRKDLMDDHLSDRKMAEVELADATIRIADFAVKKNFSIGEAIRLKLLYNVNRKDHQKEVREASGGKKF